MIVKAIKTYNDLELDRLVKLGEEFEVTEKRAEALVNAGVCEVVATPTTEKVATKSKAKAKKEA